MVEISDKFSESLSEYLILTGWIEVPPEEISLKTTLGPISLQYPFMTARMQSVVGTDMAMTAGRNGILTMIPRSLRDKDKQAIIDANNNACLKKGDVELLSNPESIDLNHTVGDAVKLVERTGYSVIPVMDRFSKLDGIYIHDPNHPLIVPPDTDIAKFMHKLSEKPKNKNEIFCLKEPVREDEIKEIFNKSSDMRFIPIIEIINGENILKEIAFLNDFDTNYMGIAIGTRGNWKEEIEKWGPQVDTLTIDSSNACFDNSLEILKYAKKKFPEKPFGIGNIIRGVHFEKFADEGADYIIGGMGVGSICKTGSERGNGRGQFTVAKELAEARDKYYENKKRYVSLVLDGSIGNVKDITVALAFADLVMMGNYFNRFYEAAARKFDSNRNPITEEANIKFVESWGEGHPRARLVYMHGINLQDSPEDSQLDLSPSFERYAHSTLSGATVEGVVGLVDYAGRLKPNVERDARYIRTTISNSGAHDLESFRKKVVLEKASGRTLEDMLPHNIKITEDKK